MTDKCALCGLEAKIVENFNSDISNFDCPRCGKFRISLEAETNLHSLENEKTKYIFSGITRYRTENGLDCITISYKNIEYLKDEYYIPRNVPQKLNLLLKYISKKSKYPGQKIDINYSLDYPITFSKNIQEFRFIIDQLTKKELIENDLVSDKIALTVDGWNKIDELNITVITKKQGFVAMWFKEEMKDIYEYGFRKAVIDSGYEPMRIDMKEHNNKIDDEIIAEIKNSAFLIADFTGQRGGVYYEAGFAMGLGIPVIWTCQENDVNELHFDTRQYNHITWNDSKDLYYKLLNRIKATIKISEK